MVNGHHGKFQAMFIRSILFNFTSVLSGVMSLSCGIDDSLVEHFNAGVGRMENYPWLGILYYPYSNALIPLQLGHSSRHLGNYGFTVEGNYRALPVERKTIENFVSDSTFDFTDQKKFTTAVVLVTKQMVIATALEIDEMPKDDFRVRARVVMGHNCSAGSGVGIRDYSYHPDYTRNTYSAIALIQLETDHVKIELRPICPPPRALHYQNENFYAMVLSDDCDKSNLMIHKMRFVSTEECKTFYRRVQLDIDTLWPTYTACAKSVTGGHCVWRSGTILVVKMGIRWSLLGFGVYGPGCQAPARFLDYGMYHEWVQHSIERIGRPAITKLAPNHIVLRRTSSNLQRFGPCDEGEVDSELYSELVDIKGAKESGKYYLNLTIIADVEYSCIVLRADYKNIIKNDKPTIRLQRYCAGAGNRAMCFTGVQFIQIQFYVEITFKEELKYSVNAYGRSVTAIDSFRAHKYANRVSNMPPIVLKHETYRTKFKDLVEDKDYLWYGKKKMKSRAVTGGPKNVTRNALLI